MFLTIFHVLSLTRQESPLIKHGIIDKNTDFSQFRCFFWPRYEWTVFATLVLIPKGAWRTVHGLCATVLSSRRSTGQCGVRGGGYPGNGVMTTVRTQVVLRGTPPGVQIHQNSWKFMKIDEISSKIMKKSWKMMKFRTSSIKNWDHADTGTLGHTDTGTLGHTDTGTLGQSDTTNTRTVGHSDSQTPRTVRHSDSQTQKNQN